MMDGMFMIWLNTVLLVFQIMIVVVHDIYCIILMEVIHHYHSTYPFGNKKEAEHTYLELVKQHGDGSTMAALRSNYKALKDSESKHLMRVVRLLKEDDRLHILYDYYPLSYYSYLEYIGSKQSVLPREKRKSLGVQFQRGIKDVMETLIKLQLKAQIYIFNVGVTSLDPPSTIKVFVDADCPKDTNELALREYYHHQANRIKIQLQEEYDRVFGVLEEQEKPNFIISGTKLVFINQVKTSKSREEQNSREEQKQHQKQQHQKQQRQKQQRQKQQFKKHQAKQDQRIRTKQADSIQKLIQNEEEQEKKKEGPYTKFQKAELISRERDFIQKSQQLERIVKELKLPHSSQPEFKPEEFTKDNTYNQEQTKYLESLQDQISKLNTQNRSIAQKRMEGREANTNTMLNHNTILSHNNMLLGNITDSLSKGEDQARSAVGESVTLKKLVSEEPVKSNKYIMKITTSHEIQIEGNEKDIEKDIMEQIKNGKLTLNTPQNLQVNQCTIAEKFGGKAEEAKMEGRKTEGKLSEFRQEPRKDQAQERNEYLNKVKEARSKAEMILKEYGKNKKQ